MRNIKIYHFKKYILLCICILLLASCAQVVAPGGGKKDTTPPQALKYTPDSASLNFKGKTIEILFDEFIQLKDLNTQLVISPPLESTPDINVKGKSLIIEFSGKEVLKDNTTYCISLGNAVQDNNENNPKENFSYIFSTGSFIDSLKLKGKVEFAFDHKTEKDILVMLYSDLNDSAVYKSLPAYFAKTKDDGSFQINNIREGKYKIRALKDVNANYKYDSESESIAFIDSLIDVTINQNIRMEMFQEPPKKLFMKKYQYNSYGKIMFVFNKKVPYLDVKSLTKKFELENSNDYLIEYNKGLDTLICWIKKDMNIDSLKLCIKATEGIKFENSILEDTLEFKVLKKEAALKSNRNPLNFTLLNSPKGNQNFDLNSEINLVFNNPVDSIIETKFEFKEDSISYKSIKPLTFDYSNPVGNTLKVGYFEWIELKDEETPENPGITSVPRFVSLLKLKQNTNYSLFVPPGTFTDIFGLKNDTLKIDFKTREEKFYGTLKLKVNAPAEWDFSKQNYIIQLLDEKENVIRMDAIENGKIINYEYLYPQKYKLKIIVDENINYKWDTGNLLDKQQPEKVIYYSDLIQVRSNWDLDLEWKISE